MLEGKNKHKGETRNSLGNIKGLPSSKTKEKTIVTNQNYLISMCYNRYDTDKKP